MNIWHIDSSCRYEASQSRKITKQFVDKLAQKTDISVECLDVGAGLPLLNEAMVGSYFTPNEQRTKEQHDAILVSNNIVDSAKTNDIWVLGIPVYNFSMPAAFKAFVDLLFRSKETFMYGENGPVGLLENKKVFVVVTSGGTEIGADNDFLTPWLIYGLNFIGVKDIQIIKADKYSAEKEGAISQQIEDMTNALIQ